MEQLPLVIALVVGVALLFWLLARQAANQTASQYRKLADSLALELDLPAAGLLGFHRPEPSLWGKFRGREVSVSVPGKGLSNTRQIETVIKVETADRTLSAQIGLAGLIRNFASKASKSDPVWKTGNSNFDSVIEIRTSHEQKFQALLTEARMQWILNTLKSNKGSIYLGNGNWAYAELGLITDDQRRERFAAMLNLLCDLAEELET